MPLEMLQQLLMQDTERWNQEDHSALLLIATILVDEANNSRPDDSAGTKRNIHHSDTSEYLSFLCMVSRGSATYVGVCRINGTACQMLDRGHGGGEEDKLTVAYTM